MVEQCTPLRFVIVLTANLPNVPSIINYSIVVSDFVHGIKYKKVIDLRSVISIVKCNKYLSSYIIYTNNKKMGQ